VAYETIACYTVVLGLSEYIKEFLI
jgi:hypothetical protein